MDTEQFVPSQTELVQQIGRGGVLRAPMNIEHNQVLIAGSRNHFEDSDAIFVCRKISGLIERFKKEYNE